MKHNTDKNAVHFYDIIEKAPIAMALTSGKELIFESINLPMLQIIHKQQADEVLGKSLSQILPELVKQPLFRAIEAVLNTGQVYQGTEVEAELNNNGVPERRFFNITYSPAESRTGERSVLHVATDVTAQVLTRRKIEESEAKLRSILNSAPTAMGVFVGEDMIVENPNQLMIDVMSAGPEIEGQSFRQLLSGLVEEDQKFIRIIETVRQTGRPFEAKEVKVIFNFGKRVRYFNISFIPLFDKTEKIYGVLDVSVDVTEHVEVRRDLEENKEILATTLEQVRLSKEAAELGTFDFDLASDTLHWDDRCRTLFGISHHAPVSYDRDFIPGLHPGDRERILAIIEKAFNKTESGGEYDVEYRTVGAEDGIVRWVRAKGKVYFNEADVPVRFIGSVLDITTQVAAIQEIERTVEVRTMELAQVNEALRLTNRELARSNQNLEEFASAASHDLKEPIRKIKFFSSQLQTELADTLSNQHSNMLNRINAAAERMGTLVEDLLRYSSVSYRPPEMEEIELNEVLNKVLEDLDLDIERTEASITIGKLPLVIGFRRQLEQMFQNLIGNALKFHKPVEKPRIEISAETSIREGKIQHLLMVRDYGIGFDQEYADKVFKIFFRLHRREDYSGSGVGLSIVKRIVENHRGHIEVESAPQSGSIFKILLPAKT